MENRFTLRRGDTPPSTENLMEYELGWDKQGKRLYMNDGGESVSLMMHEDEIVQLIYSKAFNWIYPVGSLYWSMNNTDPSTLFPGTTWEQITDRFIYAAAADATSGELAGAENGMVTLAERHIPEHSHALVGETGASTGGNISGQTDYTGEHFHSRGNMNITGHLGFRPGESFDIAVPQDTYGAFTYDYSGSTTAATESNIRNNGCQIDFNAADSWTGSTSEDGGHLHSITMSMPSHTHTLSGQTSETGESKSFSIMPPYITAYCWQRIS